MTAHDRRPATASEIAAALHDQLGAHAVRRPDDPASAQATAEAGPREARRATAADRDAPVVDYGRTLAFFRWYEGLLRAHRAAADTLVERNLRPDDPGLAGDDGATREAVHAVHRALLRHPVAAKAMFAALVAEGRRASQTLDGARLRARLSASPRLRRFTVLWRSITLGLLDDAHGGELPTMYVDALLQLADRPDLEGALGRLLGELEGAR